MEKISFEPIGILRSDKKYRYETPRQGVLAQNNKAIIELLPGQNFEQALEGLDGFERIWVLFLFHLNNNWKPKIMPPYNSEKKVGVFASRAPYRPNQIGLSCVRLAKVQGLKLFIEESDILDGSPVIDIKPYLPYSDSFPESRSGWTGLKTLMKYQISYEDSASRQIRWLKVNGGFDLEDFIDLQLSADPDNSIKKRISRVTDPDLKNVFSLAYRTWRIFYKIHYEEFLIKVFKIDSGYSVSELLNTAEDKYNDKFLHNQFKTNFRNL
ncbi:MAG: tRNA (N6-threonylcarbamoyladenosine(37)-N6)-methyltransferase TrmO [Bacillota bacterium]